MVRVITSENKQTILLWMVVSIAVLLGLAALLVATRPIAIPEPPPTPPVGIGGVAEFAVVAHLVKATQQDGSHVHAHTVSIDPAGDDQWAAHVMVADPKGFRLWQVTLDTTQSLPRVMGLPAMIPIPPVEPVRLPALRREVDDKELAATVQSALSALLTGSPDLRRYISEDSTLTPIDPPPFVGLQVTGMSDPVRIEGNVVVFVATTGQRADGVRIEAHYPLALQKTNSHWLVRGVLRAMPPTPVPAHGETHR